MYKNAERVIKRYVSVLVGIILVFVGLIGAMALIATLGGEDEAFGAFIVCLLICVGIWVSGAFLYAFADLVEQSKLQSELLMDIRKMLKKQIVEKGEQNEL